MGQVWVWASYLILALIFGVGLFVLFSPGFARSFPYGPGVRILVGLLLIGYAGVRLWFTARRSARNRIEGERHA